MGAGCGRDPNKTGAFWGMNRASGHGLPDHEGCAQSSGACTMCRFGPIALDSPIRPAAAGASCMKSSHIIQAADRILVTGASGFIGVKVVETLLEYGFRSIRCLVRPSSRRGRLDDVLQRFGRPSGVEVV